jgi:acyl carrier protein
MEKIMTQFSSEDTFAKVATIVAEKLNIDKSRVTQHATLTDLGADSLDLVEIIMKMEEQFGIEINDEDAEKMNNMADVVVYINERRTK